MTVSEDIKEAILKLRAKGKNLQEISSSVGVDITTVSDVIMREGSSSFIAGYNRDYERSQSGNPQVTFDSDDSSDNSDNSDSSSENDESEQTEEDFSKYDKPDGFDEDEDSSEFSESSDTESDNTYDDNDEANETAEADTGDTSAESDDSSDDGLKIIMSVLSSGGHIPDKLKKFTTELRAFADNEKPVSEEKLSQLIDKKNAKLAEIERIDAKIKEIQADIDFWDKLCSK